jgi:hypothetical protein
MDERVDAGSGKSHADDDLGLLLGHLMAAIRCFRHDGKDVAGVWRMRHVEVVGT